MNDYQIAEFVLSSYFPKGKPVSVSLYIALCDLWREQLKRTNQYQSTK